MTRDDDVAEGGTVIKTQLTLCLPNRPGELARALQRLTAASINIEGISVAETTDMGLVQIVVNDTDAARSLLKRAEIPITEQKVALLILPNKPGELARLAVRLAEKKVNINYLYATVPSSSGAKSAVVISAQDLEKVEALIVEITTSS